MLARAAAVEEQPGETAVHINVVLMQERDTGEAGSATLHFNKYIAHVQ